MQMRDMEILASALAQYIKRKGTIIIASVDFSHYLPENIAADKDKESFEAIKNFDYEKIHRFGNDNLDSPLSIIVLLHALKRVNASELKLIKNLNSEYFTKSNSKETTSYFTILLSPSH